MDDDDEDGMAGMPTDFAIAAKKFGLTQHHLDDDDDEYDYADSEVDYSY